MVKISLCSTLTIPLAFCSKCILSSTYLTSSFVTSVVSWMNLMWMDLQYWGWRRCKVLPYYFLMTINFSLKLKIHKRWLKNVHITVSIAFKFLLKLTAEIHCIPTLKLAANFIFLLLLISPTHLTSSCVSVQLSNSIMAVTNSTEFDVTLCDSSGG